MKNKRVFTAVICGLISLCAILIQWSLHPSYGEFIFVMIVITSSLCAIVISILGYIKQKRIFPDLLTFLLAVAFIVLSLLMASDWNIGP